MAQIIGNEPAPAARGGHRYAAFISYRHAELDRRWARWLHAALEAYRVPRKFNGGQSKRGVGRVFRDEEELAASADLNEEIERALQESAFLIVVCSPRTPPSRWINREVERFRELGRHDKILALLIEGDPADSFPVALREIRSAGVGEDAALTVASATGFLEPLAADVRPSTGNWIARKWSAVARRRTAKLRLLSSMLGVRFDDLRQRDWYRRRRRLILGAVVALMLTTGIGVVVEASARASTMRKAAAFGRRVNDGIQAADWSPDHLSEMHDALSQWEMIAAGDAAAGRTRLARAISADLDERIRRPNLDPDDIRRAKVDLVHLALIDPAAAKALADALQLRSQAWEVVAAIQPPYDALARGPWAGAFERSGDFVKFIPPANWSNWGPVLGGGAPCGARARLELVLDPSWEAQPGPRSLALVAQPTGVTTVVGYRFTIQPVGIEAGTGLPRVMNTSVQAVRATGGYIDLIIGREKGQTARSKRINVQQLKPGPLRLIATRENGLLTLQVNDLPPMHLAEDFPLPLSRSGFAAVSLVDGDRIQRLVVSRQSLPSAPNALEVADEQFISESFQDALVSYQAAAVEQSQPGVRQEARYKLAMCMLRLSRTTDATNALAAVAAEAGDRWPVVAACRLWQSYAEQGRADDAALVMDSLNARFGAGQVAASVTDDIRMSLRQFNNGQARQFSLLFPCGDEVVERLRRLLASQAVLDIAAWEQIETSLTFIRATEIRNEHDAALTEASGLLDRRDFLDELGLYEVVQEYGCLMRLAGRAEEGLRRVERFNGALTPPSPDGTTAPSDRPVALAWGLLLEHARLELACDRPANAERDLSLLLSLAPQGATTTFDSWQAAIMLGFIRLDRGDADGARQAWAAGMRGARGGDQPSPDTLRDAIYGSGLKGGLAILALGCLSDVTDEEIAVVSKTMFSAFGTGAQLAVAARGVMTMPPAVIRSLFKDPRGLAWARSFASRSDTLPALARGFLPLVMEHGFRDGAFGNTLTGDQGAACERGARLTAAMMTAGRLGSAQAVLIAMSWRGTTNALGWESFSRTLSAEERPVLAYVFGMHQLRAGRDAAGMLMLKDAVATGNGDPQSAELARAELAKRDPSQPGAAQSSPLN